MRNIMMCNNEYELALIRQRTKANMKTIVDSGRFPGKAPIGYINKTIIIDPINKKFKKEIVIDEENADFVKRAFELYATGMYSFKTLGDTLFPSTAASNVLLYFLAFALKICCFTCPL